MVQRGRLLIDDVEVSYKSLSTEDGTKQTGRWDAQVLVTPGNRDFLYSLKGYETVKIYRGGAQVFQGYLLDKPKKLEAGVTSMPLGGPEWTGKLNNYITSYESMSGVSLLTALTNILENSPYTPGVVEGGISAEADPVYWDTSLELLDFTFTNACITYAPGIEVAGEVAATAMVLCKPNLRCSFWYDGATRRFYVVAYDGTNLKYNFTANGTTWNGWNTFTGATPAATEGAGGRFTVAWHNSKLYIAVVTADPQVDLWRGTITDATGVITLAKIKNDISGAGTTYDELWSPIVFDTDGDLWVFYHKVSGNYNARESLDDGATWSEAWNDSTVKKYAIQGPEADSLFLMVYNTGRNVVELWEYTDGGGLGNWMDLYSIVNDSCGYISGFQKSGDPYNFTVIIEDQLAGGAADLIHIRWYYDGFLYFYGDASTVVANANYAAGNFSVSGDLSKRAYVFYRDSAANDLKVRIYDPTTKTFGTAAEISSDCAAATSAITAPGDNTAVYVFHLDASNHVNFILLPPIGLSVERQWYYPTKLFEDFEGAALLSVLNQRGTYDVKNTTQVYQGNYNAKLTMPAGSASGHNLLYYAWTTGQASVWADFMFSAGPANNGELMHVLSVGYNIEDYSQVMIGIINDTGVLKWWYRYVDTAGASHTGTAGTCTANTRYNLELLQLTDDPGGKVKFWVDGTLIFNLSGLSMANAGYGVRYIRVGHDKTGEGLTFTYPTGGTDYYFDNIQFSAYRIGDPLTGTVKTDTYTASGAFTAWGSLTSPSADTTSTVWSILDAADAVLLSGLTVPTDLNGAGLSSAVTVIKAYASMVGKRKLWANLIYIIGVSEKTNSVDLITDYEKCGTAVAKLANILGAEYKLRWDNTLDFAYELGEDKSDRIILLTAASLSHFPDLKPNIRSTLHEPDFDNHANCIKLLGAGTAQAGRIEATAKDQDSIVFYGTEIWDTVKNPDCVTVGMAQVAAQTQVNQRKDPRESISDDFVDDYDPGEIQIGDTVRNIDDEIQLDVDARIINIAYTWGEGERVSAELINPIKIRGLNDHLKKTENLLRWI